MKLTKIEVHNFRGLRDVSIPLSAFVCITGENNSGKSSVLQALSHFLSGSVLRSTDFFDPARKITIGLSITEITDNDLMLLAEEHRERIKTLLTDQRLTLVRQYETTGKGQLGYIGLVPKDERFWSGNVASLLAGKKGSQLKNSVSEIFPEIAEQLTSATTQGAARELIEQFGAELPAEKKVNQFIPLPTGVDNSVLPMLPERIYIPAVKDLSDDTKTAEGSSFGKILSIVMKAIEPLLAEEKDLFEKLSKKLTRLVGADGSIQDDRLDDIKKIESTIQSYVRESFANIKLEIDIPPPELKSVLSTARILADDGVKGPLELKGDGLRRSVVFSILRTYVEFVRNAARIVADQSLPERGYLLLFEEPELFLHPDAQNILFDALGVFSERNHVIVTTHSPLFLGPEAIATFIRLSKVSDPSVTQPFTKASPVDLTGLKPKDEFQIICFENNAAAFFAKRVVLVEGDSDFIAFPHIAETLNASWNCRMRSIAFIRIGGKGSIARYRSFFRRFDVPTFVITDLDTLENEFEKLSPTDEAKRLQCELLQKADAANTAEGVTPEVKNPAIKKAQIKPEIRSLWERVQQAKAAYELDRTKFAELDKAVAAFFAWEKKGIRGECIRKAKQTEVKTSHVGSIHNQPL